MHCQASKRCDGVTLASHPTSHCDYKQTLFEDTIVTAADCYSVPGLLHSDEATGSVWVTPERETTKEAAHQWYVSQNVVLEPLEMLEILRKTYTGTDASAVKWRRRITCTRFQTSPAV